MALVDDPEVRAALALLDAHFTGERRHQRVPGISVSVVAGQDIIWAAGYGNSDVARARPTTSGTIYRVGSVTKVLTVTMLMQLRDTGQLHLDDPITKCIPEFDLPSRFYEKAAPTFRQLVSYTSGMPHEAPLDYGDTDRVPPIDMLLASLPHTDLSLAPCTTYKYSNLGFAVVAHALERVAGQPYVEYVSQHILHRWAWTHPALPQA